MKELPDSERPYEKCLKYGPAFLSDAELLAVVLRTGTTGMTSVELAQEILLRRTSPAGLAGLYHLSIPQLREIRGVGEVKAIQIRCLSELARRMAKTAAGEGHRFLNAREIADYYMEDFRHLLQEQIMVLMFDTKGGLLADRVISRGTVNQAVVTPREIFLEALKNHAVYIILMHNHPSGDVHPSPEDDSMTQRVQEAGELLGIALMDHLILGDRRYFSYREAGLIIED